MMKRLAIVITHPIQYYVPVFNLLAKQCRLKVFYTWGKDWLTNKYDPGFGKKIEWDIPLLDGYEYEFLENTAKKPGSHHPKGIANPKLVENLKNFQPNAILVYGYSYKSHLYVLKYFKGKIPVWFRGDSTLLNEKSGIKSFLKKIYLQWVYAHVDKAFYVGTSNKAYFKKYGIKDSQLVFSPHAVDNERFAKKRLEEVAAFRQKLGLKTKDTIILYAGKFENVKNLAVLIQAFKLINSPKENIKLLLVGNGIQERELKKLANENTNILFLDFQNQNYLPVVYQACDIFCLPSSSETWGLAINEAMAAGNAIITSNKVGCAADLVKENFNGAIFKYNDVNSLALKIKILIKNKSLLSQYGEQSKKTIQDWCFEKQVSTLIEHLHGF